jgi:TetR/AcrR family transcriptional regulator, cholesterol catabolism regulator
VEERLRYDAKLSRILRASAIIIAEKGYHQASIRDIAAATGVSLSGLYYYFSSKEELLFLIQSHCFETILESLDRELVGVLAPLEQLDRLVRNHFRFFVANMPEMKVLSHEADSLSGDYFAQVLALKRRYLRRTREILQELSPGPSTDVRTAALLLFGLMNWIYTWYRPERDPGVEELADTVLHIFLNGYLAEVPAAGGQAPVPPAAPSIWRDS